jgi:hypothetical protein
MLSSNSYSPPYHMQSTTRKGQKQNEDKEESIKTIREKSRNYEDERDLVCSAAEILWISE